MALQQRLYKWGTRKRVAQQMGWERRGNGLYYYQKRRIGKRVVSEYVGSGELAEAVAYLDQDARIEREEARQARMQEQQAWVGLWAGMESARRVLEAELHTQMEARGLHRHKRGEWRKRRGNKET